ncbi:MAG: DNA-binding protein [Pseudopedobacter saltans]|uniref:DNA-binding protein n=1 Tax=Pseudopedobacter saltans TaxID=151895 RepID=A0A2W5FBV3_9SPHI|nr:MAG: DNA-binding protein [Pseudopedobacter saltans]
MEITIIQSRIYNVRGHKVMLDFDLAELYQTETKYLKRAVRSNLKRFPSDFMFELTKDEFENLRCNFSTSKRGGTRYMPFAFAEHGVTMLASVLNSDKAIDMNIAIVRAFVSLRQLATAQSDFVSQLKMVKDELAQRIDMHDAQLAQIYEAIENMLDEQSDKKGKEQTWENRKRIGFK